MKKEPLEAFVVDKERVKALGLLLSDYSTCSSPKEKYRIVQAFKVNHYAAFIKLYTKKTEERTEFLEKLEEFFFVGKAYFYSEPKDAKLFGVIVLSRFRNLRDIGVQSAMKCKGHFDRVPDVAWVLFGNAYKGENSFLEGIVEFTQIVVKYRKLMDDGYFIKDVLKAFISRKPVTSIDISNLRSKTVDQLINELKRFLFVEHGYYDFDLGELFVSRYKTLPKILSDYSKNNCGVYDLFSDTAGAFLLDVRKYPHLRVASYCSKSDFKELNFIK